MRVLLASGIFYPDVGGPATHVRRLAERLSGSGHTVTVVAFGERQVEAEPYRVVRVSRRRLRFVAWLLYGSALVREALRHDVIYGFDLTTAGIPCAIAAVLRGKPLILRLGGDPIWEREAESGRRFLSLREYYAQGLHRQDRPFLYQILKWTLRRADRIVVYNEFFKDFFAETYSADKSRITVIHNPLLPREDASEEKETRTVIFAGRFVAYKNLAFVIRSAAKLVEKHSSLRLLFIGDGPEKESLESLARTLHVPLEIRSKMDQKGLFQAIRNSSVAIAPALSEFNPNFILEALSLGKPVLVSKGHGLSIRLPEYMQFDPRNEASLVAAMARMADDANYADALRDVASMPMDWSWDDVLAAHETLLHELV